MFQKQNTTKFMHQEACEKQFVSHLLHIFFFTSIQDAMHKPIPILNTRYFSFRQRITEVFKRLF